MELYNFTSMLIIDQVILASLYSRSPTVQDHDRSVPRWGAVPLGSHRLPDHSGSASSLPPSNSKGVTSIGTKSPSIMFTRRICPNLFAFARCWQFHITKKSHL